MKFLKVAVLFFGLAAAFAVRAQGGTYPVSGRVIDRLSRRPVAYAAVVLAGQEQKGASTDSLGRFRIERVKPGIWRLAVSSVGYKSLTTPEYMVSAATPFIEVELEEDAAQLEAVTVRPSPFRVTAESPVSLKVIGLREIEKSPGSNRDVSRIVRSYPGVAFSPVGYRNDLIVRGGGPAENKFYMDGIEIPNINHFATQGATGGPVSIVNADLVREISFYTGAFPADRAGALSSVLDFRLRDGNAEKADLQSDVGRLGSGVERQRAHRRQDDLSVFHPPVLPATAVQTAGAALPAQLHRRAGESQDTPFGARRADGAGPCGIRQHASQRRREGRGRRIPVELPAPHPAGDLHGGGFVASLCGPPRADRDLEPQLPEQPQPEIPAQR